MKRQARQRAPKTGANMELNVADLSPFTWNPKTTQAAILLAQGYTQREVGEQVGVTPRTLQRWNTDIDFSSEVDRLSLMVGIAGRAERLRLAQRVVRQRTAGNIVETDKDLLDWVKFAQSETDGAKLDLTALLAAAEPAQVADSRLTGIGNEETGYVN